MMGRGIFLIHCRKSFPFCNRAAGETPATEGSCDRGHKHPPLPNVLEKQRPAVQAPKNAPTTQLYSLISNVFNNFAYLMLIGGRGKKFAPALLKLEQPVVCGVMK
jgi:hypothetical protein